MLNVWCGESLRKPYINDQKHTVILSFWATYCAPCMKEIPKLMEFAKSHKNQNIKIFLINIDNSKAKVESLVRKEGYNLPVLLDPYKRTAGRYGVKSLPALFVIDPEGIIRYSSTGYDENADFTGILEDAVEAAQQGENTGVPDMSDIGSSDIVETKAVPLDFTAHQKYQAVIRVECGEKPVNVAEDIGVSVKRLKKWYNSLNEAVKAIWPKRTDSE